MRKARRYQFVLMAAAAALVFGTWTADAKPKTKNLRLQIVDLKTKLAQLESQVQFQGRRLDMMPPLTGGGLCTDPCTLDTDEDGQGDCVDPCPCDPTNRDDDADGIADCVDPCPGDGTNACIDPCHMDSDGDGTPDCQDACPWDSHPASDHDGDGISDCSDPCPDDDHNSCSGPCMLDSDGDGLGDCMDPCPFSEGLEGPCGDHSGTGMGPGM